MPIFVEILPSKLYGEWYKSAQQRKKHKYSHNAQAKRCVLGKQWRRVNHDQVKRNTISNNKQAALHWRHH
jgi:hypothetical protein